jgi:hypothetical protein
MPSQADSTRTPSASNRSISSSRCSRLRPNRSRFGDQDDLDLTYTGGRAQIVQRRPRRCRPGHAGIDELASQRETMPPGQLAALVALGVDRGPADLALGRDPQVGGSAGRSSSGTPSRSTHNRHHQVRAAAAQTISVEPMPIPVH